MTDRAPAASEELKRLVREAPLSFLGTVTRVGGTSLAAFPADVRDDRTTVVKVNEVLHAPDAFRHLAGSEVTVQLASDADLLEVGETAAFFTRGMVYGESLGLAEVGRLPASAVQPHVSMAATTADEMPLSSVQRENRNKDIAEHARAADAVVVGTVAALEDLGLPAFSEHAPLLWRATLDVSHVEKGPVNGRTTFLYPRSGDVRWRHIPKPVAGQLGLWLLHDTPSDLAAQAPYQLSDPDDYQPVQNLAVLREGQ
ncbi:MULTISPECIES: hypothetical protein [Kitasatospora]|uniref:Uncharacterized protein n=1 Tax=Kitasatospora cathayae TaxID=3004092 RepID=A0ABY7QCS6_9ACTN|nr:hypothetical protein [Kitasatospora sp. HUAS 3-15]WBP90555.1 hypothetical protein O1G21_34965 [Kitasatospora sp. HUAS 3-15]